MSFTFHPYKVMIITQNDDDTVSWSCDSCGGGWRETFPEDTPVSELRKSYDEHVLTSHELTREDVASWSVGV